MSPAARASKRRRLSPTTADKENEPGTTSPPDATHSGQPPSAHDITPRRRSTRTKANSSSKPSPQAPSSAQNRSRPASNPKPSKRHDAIGVADTPGKITGSGRKQAKGRKTPQSAARARSKNAAQPRRAPHGDDQATEGEDDESDELARDEPPTEKAVPEDDGDNGSQRRDTTIQLGASSRRRGNEQEKTRHGRKHEVTQKQKHLAEEDPEPSEDDAASFRTAPSHEDSAQAEPDSQAERQTILPLTSLPPPYQTLSLSQQSTSPALTALQTIALQKLTHRRRTPLVALTPERSKIHHLLHQTVAHGESNSLLLIGARGTGKTALVEDVLAELSTDENHRDNFHTIRLNGFFQTDDKLALREIWRQLGREMELDEHEQREVGGGARNYADTLATLLALFSHTPDTAMDDAQPNESGAVNGDNTPQNATNTDNAQIAAKSVLFILTEFDLFASRPRQTLLYNLLDIAQSQKAPIAVLGLSTRIDVAEGLEKRVKSRFSHRYVHVGGALKNFKTFEAVCRAAVGVKREDLGFRERMDVLGRGGGGAGAGGGGVEDGPGDDDPISTWNRIADELLARHDIQTTLTRIYHTTKSIAEAFSALYLPISTLPPKTTKTTPSSPAPPASTLTPNTPSFLPPPSPLSHFPSLSTLALSLLIASARLEIILATPVLTFPLAYEEYISLAKRTKLRDATASGGAGAGGRVWGREVARGAWEGELLRSGLVVSEGGGGGGGTGGMGEENVRCEVALEEIEGACAGGEGLERGMEKWCREI
ncbi:MAG: hypothetical protein M1831_005155 [Alyxoria varia]|nr:MAG: hypothetical protein M1831_005155 [Alyxoria varia]